ncbi:MAG: NPCBM/NEW2 domain-containing protein [Planctomycetes bacterium]|nr:NPCBM/NEW2 domain-containing protein [Planctomycetota bacterium]
MDHSQVASEPRPKLKIRPITLFLLAFLSLSSWTTEITGQESELREIPAVYQTLQGKFPGILSTITPETSTLKIGDSTASLKDLVQIEFSGKVAESSASANLILREGGSWRGRFDLRRLDGGDQIYWNSPSLTQVLELPLESIEKYLATGVDESELGEGSTDSDFLLTADGAKLTGILESLDMNQITFDDESLGLLKIEWSKVRAFQLVALDDEPEEPAKSGFSIDVVTRDGSSPKGLLVKIDTEEVRIQSGSSQEIRIPVDRILRVNFANDRVVPLTDRSPIKVIEGLGEGRWFPWSWQKDRNVLGAPLTIGARSFDKGIGVHSNSLLSFKIEPGDLTLNGFAGMDASAKPKDEESEIGNARFSILVDGNVAWGPHDISWQDAPRPFSISLEGKTGFTLKVDMGSGIHILDRANWVATQIIRQ